MLIVGGVAAALAAAGSFVVLHGLAGVVVCLVFLNLTVLAIARLRLLARRRSGTRRPRRQNY
jgi:hypothetical protein